VKRSTRRNLVRYTAYAVVVGGLLAYSTQLTLGYEWHWVTFFQKWLPLLAWGLLYTLGISATALCIALPLGIAVGLARISRDPGARLFGFVYVELIRGTPLLVQVMLWYWVLGTPFRMGEFGAAVCALSCFAASYIAEIVRAGIQSIERGQMEAARSLGLTHFQAMRTIVVPQALRRVLPPLASEFIALVKDSSLASVIAFEELSKRATDIGSREMMPFEPWITAAAMYLVINVILSLGVRTLEHRLGVNHQEQVIR